MIPSFATTFSEYPVFFLIRVLFNWPGSFNFYKTEKKKYKIKWNFVVEYLIYSSLWKNGNKRSETWKLKSNLGKKLYSTLWPYFQDNIYFFPFKFTVSQCSLAENLINPTLLHKIEPFNCETLACAVQCKGVWNIFNPSPCTATWLDVYLQ